MSITNETAVRGDCSSHSRLFQTILSDNKYSTGNSSSVNTCSKCVGRERAERGERATRVVLALLKKTGHKKIQQIDFIAQDVYGNRINYEIKGKRLFEPGPGFPYFGIGLNKNQLWLRTQLLKDKGERTILINYVEETDYIYAAYIDELEKGIHHDTTKQEIRVYPVDNFKTAKFAELILYDPELILRWLGDER